MAKDSKKEGEGIALLEEKKPFTRPKIGTPVQFLTNAKLPLAAVVVAAYAEKDPTDKDVMIEYANLRVFEARRTSDTPYYQRVRYGNEANCWRYLEDDVKEEKK